MKKLISADGEWLYVVCRYSPPGNVMSSGGDRFKYFKQNVLKTGEDLCLLQSQTSNVMGSRRLSN